MDEEVCKTLRGAYDRLIGSTNNWRLYSPAIEDFLVVTAYAARFDDELKSALREAKPVLEEWCDKKNPAVEELFRVVRERIGTLERKSTDSSP